MNLFQLSTASLILTTLSLPVAAAQFGPGILRAGEYATVVEFSGDSPLVQNVPVVAVPPLKSRVIDLAICLDTSGSMDGLIDSAKQRLWSIVNDLALADPAPELRVALLTFGNDGHDAENGWVRVDSELTGDLDLISQQLFALQTNGGTELVGRVVSVATGKLNWSQDPNALKLAVVAGNESADQDAVVSFRDACAAAIKNGIMVNSIYCGNPADAEAPLWKEVSLRADGHFATIDHQNGTLAIDTPFDQQLVALTGSVNPTYLPFGENGASSWANQTLQDTNAIGLNNDAAANRAMCKNGALYVCGWDLVDASKQEGFDLASIEVEELPEVMRTMTLEERQAHIDANAAKRAEIQAEIAEVGQQREAWLTQQMKRLALDESNSFDHQLRNAIRSQVSQQGFQFPKPAVVPQPEQATPAGGPATVSVTGNPSQQSGLQIETAGSQLRAQQIVPASSQGQPLTPATGNHAPVTEQPEAQTRTEQVEVIEGVQAEEDPSIVPEDC
jgi:von Willebrand factor type A domain-containing protein